ncbi:MAG TPA: hypothetical protein VGE02_13610 [Gemmatimonadales bacterium]
MSHLSEGPGAPTVHENVPETDHSGSPSLDLMLVPPTSERLGPRVRLREFRFNRTQAAICIAEVELEAPDGRRVVGRARGASIPTGELRAAAEATLAALSLLAPPGSLGLELGGVKSLRAFDETVVIVSVTGDRLGEPARLLGCVLAGEDLVRGAVLATLSATNRVLTFGVRH